MSFGRVVEGLLLTHKLLTPRANNLHVSNPIALMILRSPEPGEGRSPELVEGHQEQMIFIHLTCPLFGDRDLVQYVNRRG